MRLAKSGYYDEKRAEKVAEKAEDGKGMEQMKEAPTKGGFSERREALKPKVQDALRKQEYGKTHDIGQLDLCQYIGHKKSKAFMQHR